jgi:hypothetical protein
MYSSKEFFDILNLIKNNIDNESIIITDEMFSKDYLKSMILSNQLICSSLNFMKEKYKTINEKNKNVFHMIKNSNKKHQKENKIILQNLPLDNFSIFYNEPKYIEVLNLEIYSKITEVIKGIAKRISLITIING